MSKKLTRLRVPGQQAFSGLMDWGEKSASEMVSEARAYAKHLHAMADAIDATPDAGFQIDLVLGSVVQRQIKEIQSAAPERGAP